mmetsp:Transcript_36480/g.74125  ORF Transcript_36480/g.74125 Transcript_36480/m.74125 type:complete len:336 (-) Transcript_36480:86-1093(-)
MASSTSSSSLPPPPSRTPPPPPPPSSSSSNSSRPSKGVGRAGPPPPPPPPPPQKPPPPPVSSSRPAPAKPSPAPVAAPASSSSAAAAPTKVVKEEDEDCDADWSSWILPVQALRDSPSRKDKMSEEEERRYRRKTVIFMENLSEKVRIDWQSQATAQIFFHYFFARHSFRRHQRFNVAVACLFLAAKVEECDSPHARHLEPLVKHSHELWHRLQPNYVPLSGGSAEYQTLSQDILACERKILHTIAFDFIVEKVRERFRCLSVKGKEPSNPLPPPLLPGITHFTRYTQDQSTHLQTIQKSRINMVHGDGVREKNNEVGAACFESGFVDFVGQNLF